MKSTESTTPEEAARTANTPAAECGMNRTDPAAASAPGNPQTPGTASASDASDAEGTGRKEEESPAVPADTAPGCTAKSLRTSLRDGIEQRRRALARRIEYNRLRRIRRHSVPAYVHCKNCGETLRGMYCHRCGQYALDPEQPFWKYFKQYFENVYQFNSKVWQTLWLLFRRPGILTLEFIAGKINSYVHPLRLFMFISALFFLAVALFIPENVDIALGPREKQLSELRDPDMLRALQVSQGDDEDYDLLRKDTTVWVAGAREEFRGLESIAGVIDRPGRDTLQVRIPGFLLEEGYLVSAPGDSIHWSSSSPLRPESTKQDSEAQDLRREMVYAHIIGWFSKWLPVILLLFIPFFALLLKIFFHRRKMFYMGHFVTALHLHSVQLILVFITLLGAQWIDRPGCYALLLLGFYLLHMVCVFHRVYGDGWVKTSFKALLIHGFYMLVMSVVLLGLFIWLILPLMKENNWW